MQFKLIVPPAFVDAIVGFVCGGEKTIGKTLWRVEVYRGEFFPRVYQNGKRLAGIAICPPMIQRMGYELSQIAKEQRR